MPAANSSNATHPAVRRGGGEDRCQREGAVQMTGPSRKKGGLGRGLASLIPTGPGDGTATAADRGAGIGPRMGDAAADVVLGGGAPATPGEAEVGRSEERRVG